MKNKEIIEILKEDEENNYRLGVSANILAIISLLIDKKITTEKDFEKLQKYCLEEVRKIQVENMTDELKKQIEVMKGFKNLFGEIWGKTKERSSNGD